MVFVLAAILVLAGCDVGGVASPAPVAPPAATAVVGGLGKYAGPVGGTRTFVGIVVEGNEAAALLTDGTESVGVFAWFADEVKEGTFQATTNNIGLRARIGADSASGTVTMPDGRDLNFVAPRVTGGAGPYRAESNTAGQPYTAGWIVLPNGEQRAAAAYGTGDIGRVVAVLPLDFGPDGRPTIVDVPDVGRFQPEPLLP
jgi:hypothetical protein